MTNISDLNEEAPRGALFLGYTCYPVPFLYLIFMPTLDWILGTVTRSLQGLLGNFLAGPIVMAGFGAAVIFPSIAGPIVFLSSGNRLIRPRIVLGNAVLALCFITGLLVGFSESRWVILDVAFVGHLAGNGLRIPSTTLIAWGLFGLLIASVLLPQFSLWALFDVAAGTYALVLAVAAATNKLTIEGLR